MVELDLSTEDFEGQPDYHKYRIHDIIFLSRLKLSLLADYMKKMDRVIFDEATIFRSKIDKMKSEEQADHHMEDWILMVQNWPEFLYRSAILTVQSVIENCLNDFCESIRDKRNSNISFRDLKGSGINRAVHYIEKIGNVQFDKDDTDWRQLRMLSEIRNCIAHGDGIIKNNALAAEIINVDGIELTNYREIIISSKYCENIIASAGRFIANLGESCKEK